MSHEDSRPNNDSRANRLPYHAEPRQGRFGRVENWREAEEKKIEELRQRRHAASRSSAHRQRTQTPRSYTQSQQKAGGYQNLQSKSSQAKARPAAQPQANTQNAQQNARPREEINPWQQGRFGRVENWREVEERRRAQELELEKQREAALKANRQKAQAAAQQTAQKRSSKQNQAPLGAHSRQAIRAQQEAKHAHHASAKPAATAAENRKVAYSAQQNVPLQEDIQEDTYQDDYQSEPSGKLTAKSYARETYTSTKGVKPIVFNAGSQDSKSKFDRRPAVEHPPGRDKPARPGGSKRNISPKLIAIIAAVFIVIIGIGAFNLFAQSGGTDSSGAAQTEGGTNAPSLPTPIMSESSGITMHSAVAMEDLTEILIHNASYAYANEITTQLPEATNTEVIAAHGTGRVLADQPTGDSWIVGEFIRCFRSGNAGPTMSAIDCGGPVGATVYAPVTGEVVLVKQYKLYGEIDDYRVHIQPTGRPDLDVVLIHLTDVTVKAGDKVTAGVTPIAKIRDLFQYLDESLQLKSYTAENDNGNHTHIQVNNANHPEYTALDELKPAPAGNAQISE